MIGEGAQIRFLIAMTDESPNFSEYHRQGLACLTMARLSDLPDIQARWLLMSQTWFRLAEKTLEPRKPQSASSNVIPLRWGM